MANPLTALSFIGSLNNVGPVELPKPLPERPGISLQSVKDALAGISPLDLGAPKAIPSFPVRADENGLPIEQRKMTTVNGMKVPLASKKIKVEQAALPFTFNGTFSVGRKN